MTIQALDTKSCELCGKTFSGKARFAQLGAHKKHEHGSIIREIKPIFIPAEDMPLAHSITVPEVLKPAAVWVPALLLLPMAILGIIAGSSFGAILFSFLLALAVAPFMVWSYTLRHLREIVIHEVDPETLVKSRIHLYVHKEQLVWFLKKYPEVRESKWSGKKESYEFVKTPEGLAIFQPHTVTRTHATPQMLYTITVQDDVETVNKTPDTAAATRRNISLGAIALAYGAAFFLVQELMPKVPPVIEAVPK